MARAGRGARPSAAIVLALVATLIVALWTPSLAQAAPVKPTEAQIAAAERQRRADIASLGRLTGQIAALDGEIERQRATLDAAVRHYNETSAALQAAVVATEARTKDVVAARTALDQARLASRVQARQAYVNRDTGSSVILAEDPNRAVTASDYHRYVVARQRNAVSDLALARVTSSNAEANAELAEERRRVLQEQAADQRDRVISGLKAFQNRKIELAAQRVKLNQQAALTFGRLNKLLTQKAAYAAWAKRQAELAAAEAARQAAIRSQQQQSGGDSTTTATPMPVLAPASGGTWGNPMAAGTYEISSCFCARWGTFHYGVDFAAALGTPMYSVGAGTVVAAGPAQGFGNWVVIDHGTGEFSVYGHMRILAVSVGQPVVRGQMIAYVGTEGDSTGPHLHLEIRLGGIDGTRIDPQVWLAQRGVYV